MQINITDISIWRCHKVQWCCVSVTGSHQKRGEANVDVKHENIGNIKYRREIRLKTWICLLEKVKTVFSQKTVVKHGKLKHLYKKTPDRNTSKTNILLGQSGHQSYTKWTARGLLGSCFFMALNLFIWLVVEPTHLKKYLSKLGSSSPNRGEHKTYLKAPPGNKWVETAIWFSIAHH